MQTEIALSTTEAEYISLSQSVRDLIPLLTIIKELKMVFNVKYDKTKVFKDKKGCI